MNRLLPYFALALFLISSSTGVVSDEIKTTNIRVIAYEYYDYYALPDHEKWKKVRSVKIEGSNSAGSISNYQTGPAGTLEVILSNVAVPSDYWVTVTWQGGEKYYRSFTSNAQTEIVHQVYQPY